MLMCDLLVEGEGPQHVVEHARELLGVAVEPSLHVQRLEKGEPPALAAVWDPASSPSADSGPLLRGKGGAPIAVALLRHLRAALLLVVAAMLLAAWWHTRGGFDQYDGENDGGEGGGEPDDPLETQETWE